VSLFPHACTLAHPTHRSLVLRQMCARTVCNLVCYPAFQEKVLENQGLKALTDLAANAASPVTQRWAAMALRHLAWMAPQRVHLVDVGAIRPLTDIVADPTAEVGTRVACAEALAFLGTVTEGEQALMKGGVITSLAAACRQNDPNKAVMYWSAVVVCNLTANPDLHARLLRQSTLPAIAAVSESFDHRTVETAARALFNLSTTVQGCLALTSNRTLAKTMRNLCTARDAQARQWLALVLANVSVVPRCQLPLMELKTVHLIGECVPSPPQSMCTGVVHGCAGCAGCAVCVVCCVLCVACRVLVHAHRCGSIVH